MTDEERILFLLSLGRTIDVPTLPPDAFPLFAFGLGTSSGPFCGVARSTESIGGRRVP